ncbi:MAG: EamA family transporter [Candidatus Bilamarchaeaceae archaeon]
MLFAFLCLLFEAVLAVATKFAFSLSGRHRTLAYRYLFTSLLFIIAGLISGVGFPDHNLPLLLVEIAVGSIAIIAFFKALDMGNVSMVNALSQSTALLVIIFSWIFLGATLPADKLVPAVLIVISSIVISFGKGKLDKAALITIFTVFLWGIYYTLLQVAIADFGPIAAAVYLEVGITVVIWAYELIRGREMSVPKPGDLLFIAFTGGLLFFSSILLNLSVTDIGSSLTLAIVAGTPMLVALFGWFFLKDRLSTAQYGAIAVLAASLILLAL